MLFCVMLLSLLLLRVDSGRFGMIASLDGFDRGGFQRSKPRLSSSRCSCCYAQLFMCFQRDTGPTFLLMTGGMGVCIGRDEGR